MAVDDLIAQLAGQGDARTEAFKRLAQIGEPAVAPLVATLLDEGSPVDWSDAGVILRQIGRPAFQPLVDAIVIVRPRAWGAQRRSADLSHAGVNMWPC